MFLFYFYQFPIQRPHICLTFPSVKGEGCYTPLIKCFPSPIIFFQDASGNEFYTLKLAFKNLDVINSQTICKEKPYLLRFTRYYFCMPHSIIYSHSKPVRQVRAREDVSNLFRIIHLIIRYRAGIQAQEVLITFF